MLGLTQPNDPTIKVLKVIVGAQDYANFQKEIEEALHPEQPWAAQPPGVGATVNVAGKQFKGNKDAKLTLIEFSDYECSFCAREAQETFPKIEQDYLRTGRLKFVFSDLVLNAHPHASKAAEASWCAAAQGKYWEMHDLLFAHQQALEPTNLVAYAADLGLDTIGFQQCLESSQYAAQVKNSGAESRQAGFSNTPTYALGLAQPDSTVKVLKVFLGTLDYKAFQAELENLLNPKPLLALPSPAVGASLNVADKPFKGDENATVTLIEFADYQCPSCARHARDTEPQILKNYVRTGKLKYVFNDDPLPMHSNAAKAAEAARCAGAQGKYWEMHDLLLANPQALAAPNLSAYAKGAGLDVAAFQQCLDSGSTAAQVRQSIGDAKRAGVVGTPTFALGLTQPTDSTIKVLKVIVGAQPYAVFQDAIDTLLKSAPAKTLDGSASLSLK